jgi:hypothetical protein
MHGDQKFILKHKAIDPRVADAWREHMTDAALGPPARRIAAEYGYDFVDAAREEMTRDASARPLATAADPGEDASALLERLDDLSDDEVLALLQKHQADEELDA